MRPRARTDPATVAGMYDPMGEPPRHHETGVPADPMSVAVEDIPVIEMPDGLPGYPDAREFVLERLDDLGCLGTLRALVDQGPAFFVVPPAVWFPDYEPVLDEITCASLELAEPADALLLLGSTTALPVALVAIAIWGMMFAADEPIRQAYINDMIPSKQRATVLSFDSLLGSSGGVVLQPGLGRIADAHGYPLSFLLSGLFAGIALPFLVASRRERSPADRARDDDDAQA